MKKLFGVFRRDRETLKAVLEVFFLPQDQAVPRLQWKKSRDPQADLVYLVLYYYARILFELAELNETRVARELMEFVRRIAGRLFNPAGPPTRFQIPLGKLRLGKSLDQPADRLYAAKFFSNGRGGYRLDFQRVIGKENYYLPASFLILLQFCIDDLKDDHLTRLAQGLVRIHHYYRVQGNFWEGASLTQGPAYALGGEALTEAELSEAPEAVE